MLKAAFTLYLSLIVRRYICEVQLGDTLKAVHDVPACMLSYNAVGPG